LCFTTFIKINSTEPIKQAYFLQVFFSYFHKKGGRQNIGDKSSFHSKELRILIENHSKTFEIQEHISKNYWEDPIAKFCSRLATNSHNLSLNSVLG